MLNVRLECDGNVVKQANDSACVSTATSYCRSHVYCGKKCRGCIARDDENRSRDSRVPPMPYNRLVSK